MLPDVDLKPPFNITRASHVVLEVNDLVRSRDFRDKLAASKQRGMWMGGVVPLGYKPNGRTLDIAAEHGSPRRTGGRR